MQALPSWWRLLFFVTTALARQLFTPINRIYSRTDFIKSLSELRCSHDFGRPGSMTP